MKEVTIKMTEKELAEVNKVLGALGKKIVPEEFKKSKKVDIEPEEPFNYTDEGPTAAEINGGGWVFIHSSFFEDANMADANDVQVFANKTDIYLTDLRRDQIDWEDNEVENWGSTARNFAGDLGIEVSEIWNCVNPYGDTCTINVSNHFINIHYTGNGVYENEEEDRGPGWYKDPATGEWDWDRDAAETARMEEEEEEKKEETKKVESYTEEDTIHIIPEMLEAAGINRKHHLYIFGNDDDHVLYITDLRKEDIDWGEQDVEEWCNGVIFNSFGEIEIEAKNFWPADLCNPYGGNKMTADYTDHIITVTLEVDEDYFEQWSKEIRIVPQEFTIITDAEGRGTISRKILKAADLLDYGSLDIFKNDSGTKLYITYSDHPYKDFDGEVCSHVKEVKCSDKNSLRIKIGGESYTKYRVHTDKDVITIDLNSGVMVDDNDLTMDQIDKRVSKMNKEERESEETEKKIKEYADKKIREDKEQEELKKKAEELVYQIFGDVEKIKVMTGLDLTDLITKVVKAILSGKKVF